MLAQALSDYERLLCSGCGHPLYETADPATENDWYAGFPLRCHACTAVSQAAKAAKDLPDPSALRFGARRLSLIPADELAADRQKAAWYAEKED